MSKPSMADAILERLPEFSGPHSEGSRVLSGATKVDVSEPAEYMFGEGAPKARVHRLFMGTRVMPPFESLWMEWSQDNHIGAAIGNIGGLFITVDAASIPGVDPASKFVVFTSLFFHEPARKLVMPVASGTLQLDTGGSLVGIDITPGDEGTDPIRLAGMSVFLFSLQLMHAKGVKIKRVKVPKKVAARRARKGKARFAFSTIDLGLAPTRLEGGSSSEPGRRALVRHLRRGNFAVYTPEKPHVSGYVGAMWRRPTVVARASVESKETDYKVRVEG